MDNAFEPGPGTTPWPRRELLRTMLNLASMVAIRVATSDTAAASAEQAQTQVTIDNFAFAPAVLRVRKGDEVTWTNHDDIPHTIVVPELKTRSKTLDTDESYAYRFESAGTFDYLCGLHPHMKGKVIVS